MSTKKMENEEEFPITKEELEDEKAEIIASDPDGWKNWPNALEGAARLRVQQKKWYAKKLVEWEAARNEMDARHEQEREEMEAGHAEGRRIMEARWARERSASKVKNEREQKEMGAARRKDLMGLNVKFIAFLGAAVAALIVARSLDPTAPTGRHHQYQSDGYGDE